MNMIGERPWKSLCWDTFTLVDEHHGREHPLDRQHIQQLESLYLIERFSEPHFEQMHYHPYEEPRFRVKAEYGQLTIAKFTQWLYTREVPKNAFILDDVLRDQSTFRWSVTFPFRNGRILDPALRGNNAEWRELILLRKFAMDLRLTELCNDIIFRAFFDLYRTPPNDRIRVLSGMSDTIELLKARPDDAFEQLFIGYYVTAKAWHWNEEYNWIRKLDVDFVLRMMKRYETLVGCNTEALTRAGTHVEALHYDPQPQDYYI
ncbi:MAG: hypothetical protein M1820_007750 [Bogoriella megaspora]|nr:MAG: hypothetical protein M1820_007750 [Bogoriella megaspora]